MAEETIVSVDADTFDVVKQTTTTKRVYLSAMQKTLDDLNAEKVAYNRALAWMLKQTSEMRAYIALPPDPQPSIDALEIEIARLLTAAGR